MKLGKLFMFALALFAFTMTSCGDDENEGCTTCSLSALFLSCDIEVCEDGSTSSDGDDVTCGTGETAITLAGATTQQEKIDALTNAGFSCN